MKIKYGTDLLRGPPRLALLFQIDSGDFDAVFIGVPCATFSVALGADRDDAHVLRSWSEPDGLASLFGAARARLDAGNAHVSFSVLVARRCLARQLPVIIENPHDRSVRGTMAFWPARAHLPPLWAHSEIVALREEAAALHAPMSLLSLPQCAFGRGPSGKLFLKWTQLLCSPDVAARLGGLANLGCGHGFHDKTVGYDDNGVARSADAAAYPLQMNRTLFFGLTGARTAEPLIGVDAAARAPSPAPSSAAAPSLFADSSDSESSDEETEISLDHRTFVFGADDSVGDGSSGASSSPPNPPEPSVPLQPAGRVTDGPALAPAVAALVEAARAAPPKWASLRNKEPATAAELAATPAPVPLQPEHTDAVPPPASDRCAVLARGRAACGGNIHISRLWRPGIYKNEVQAWLTKAKWGKRLKTRKWGQECLEDWAQGTIWDCADPDNCIPMEPSTRDTAFPGAKQLNRARLREADAELGWPNNDDNAQSGEGGIEFRSKVEMATVLATHHSGLFLKKDSATKAIEQEEREGWATVGSLHLPIVPCVCNPRDIIEQPRSRPRADGSIEHYVKDRITLNLSHDSDEARRRHEHDSVNSGIDKEDRTMSLPSIRSFGLGAALTQNAFDRAKLQAYMYCVDCESAYSFCVVQRLEWWVHCYLWWDDQGRAIVKVLMRLGFGGANAPKRFMGVSRKATALAAKRQRDFDATAPFPREVDCWRAERRVLQALGQLPAGPEQDWPAALQVYLDDAAGAAGSDEVDVPAGYDLAPTTAFPLGSRGVAVGGVDPGELSSVAAGGGALPPGTRAAVHLAILVRTLEWLGFIIPSAKTEAGRVIVNLGARFDLDRLRIDCPPPKQSVILDSIEVQSRAADQCSLERRAVDKLVGRLVFFSQPLPELVPYLRGGYNITKAARRNRRGEKRLLSVVPLSIGGAAQRGFQQLMTVARAAFTLNDGIPLAPAAHFRPIDSPSTLVLTTDASGDVHDAGVGGYAFHSDAPNTVFIVSEEWPAEIWAALLESARPPRERTVGALRCSMPAAELFGALALAQAVAAQLDVAAVVAIGDCKPAAGALNAAASPVPQMQGLVVAARAGVQQWLGVAVPRELNIDADRLSHPSQAAAVEADARQAGWLVQRLAVPDHCWRSLAAKLSDDAGEWVEDDGDWKLR